MGFAALSAFEFANLDAGETFYDVHLLSETGGPMNSSLGMSVETEQFGDEPFDTILVRRSRRPDAGHAGAASLSSSAKLGEARRVAAICTGAFVLAEAGLLDGRGQRHIGAMRASFRHGSRR